MRTITKENMTHEYTATVSSPDADFEHIFMREMCRELIMEDIGSIDIDEAIFEEVMRMIQRDTGAQNMFDAPILYTLVGFRKQAIEEPK